MCCVGILCVGDGVDDSFCRCRVGLMHFLWGVCCSWGCVGELYRGRSASCSIGDGGPIEVVWH